MTFPSALTRFENGPRVTLRHKLADERVDLELGGQAGRVAALRERLADVLPAGATVIPAGKSAAISMKAPRVSLGGDFAEQAADCTAGIRIAHVLQVWWNEHGPEVIARMR